MLKRSCVSSKEMYIHAYMAQHTLNLNKLAYRWGVPEPYMTTYLESSLPKNASVHPNVHQMSKKRVW
jgi:hypothetical protein